MAATPMKEVVNLVNGEASRLGEFLSGLSAQDWSRQSACEGWVIGDVVAHLTGGAESWANSINRALTGDAGPPPGQGFLTEGDRGSEVIGETARASYQQLGTQLLEKFTAGYDHLAQVLATLDVEDWKRSSFHRRGSMPIGDYVEVRVQELVVHSWDIRSGVDQAAELGEESLALMVGRVPRWVSNAFRPGLDLPTPIRYRFDVQNPVPVKEDLLVKGDSFQAEPTGGEPADVTFRCNTGSYILLIYGRLDVEGAIAAGQLTVDGSREKANSFTAWFQGF